MASRHIPFLATGVKSEKCRARKLVPSAGLAGAHPVAHSSAAPFDRVHRRLRRTAKPFKWTYDGRR